MSTKSTSTKNTENGAVSESKNGNDALLQRVAELERELESSAMDSFMRDAVNSGWASIEFTPDGIIQEVNDNWVKTLGYTAKEMVGQHHRMFCDPQYAKSAEYKKFWADLADGHINSGEFKRYKKGGDPLYINASYTPIKDGKGNVVRVIKIAADITEMTIKRDQGEAIKAAVDTGWASIEFTPDGIIQTANQNFLETTGYELDEVLGQHHRIFCDAEYGKSTEYKNFWKQLAKGHTNAGEFKRYTKNGDEIYLQASYTPIKDQNGEVVKVIKIATEITEQKNKNADYEGQIEAVKKAQAVIEFNLDGTIIDANENFLDAVGYKLSEIKGQHHKIFCDAEFSSSNAYKEFWASLNRGEYTNGEFERYDKNGNSLWLQANYNPIMDLNGKPFKVVKYATNITAQKQAMHELRRVIRVVTE